MYTREQIQAAVESKGYRWFEKGDYNVNIVGVRNSDTNGKVTNKFDDKITITYKIAGEWKFHIYVKVYRDANKDGVYDYDESTVDEGLFGINIHRATALSGKTSTYIDKWSAGCQVIANNDDWHEFLDICEKARDTWNNNFTYTLIESNDIGA